MYLVKKVFCGFCSFFPVFAVFAASLVMCNKAFSQEVLRARICVELEPLYAIDLGVKSPLDNATATLWALEDAQSVFSAMIYGWSFLYEPENKSRKIEELLDLTPIGTIQFGDENMKITDASKENDLFFIWVDYELDLPQQQRVKAWRSAPTFNANAQGYGPLHGWGNISDRRDIKRIALEDAAKKAIKAKLQVLLKSRPKSARGFIALSDFPLFQMNGGQWSCVAHFRIEITDTENYSAF
ncbi:MAG: hypothetical protein LBV52_03780 [Spirochaetaceae bacterium]|jgi:hypothetical protein|nr:hypothetical protein [Spirochaetaceae bacterium]